MSQYAPRRAAARWLEGAPPEILGCWDNGGTKRATADRYTIAFGGGYYAAPSPGRDPRLVPMLGVNGVPTHPQYGISMWGEGIRGPHLGKKIRWKDLPEHIRRHVLARMKEGEEKANGNDES